MIYILYERQSDVYKYNQLGQSAAQLPVTHPSTKEAHSAERRENKRSEEDECDGI